MKTWKKKSDAYKTITDVVLANTGMTEAEIFNSDENYVIDELDKAATYIKQFSAEGKPIRVYADYDVDGISAASIMSAAIGAIGGKCSVRLPRRFSEGYGLSESMVDEMDDGEGLLITVDNGIVAFDAVQRAKDKGLTVIVTDHHLMSDDGCLPIADVIIDPKALPQTATFDGYCGAGIAYKLAVEILGKDHRVIPKLKAIAAIATVADVMPLLKENRIIVKEGMECLTNFQTRTTGLGALLKACDMDKYINPTGIGFKIAPIINAPGRMNDDGAMESYELVSFDGRSEVAMEMANKLIEVNEERKKAKEAGVIKLEQQIIDNCMFGECPLTLYDPELPEGLVGIFAGVLAEKYGVPCFVFTDSENPDILKGSGRSCGGVHLKNLLDANADVLYKYGGHAEAAGVSCLRANYEEMRNRLCASCPNVVTKDADVEYYDLEISARQVSGLLDELERCGPFGEGNPNIRFKINGFTLTPTANGYFRTMGDNKQHVKLFGPDGLVAVGFDLTEKFLNPNNDGAIKGFIKTFLDENGRYPTHADFRKNGMSEPPTSISIIGTITKNYFMGKFSTQIEIVDLQNASITTPKTDLAAFLSSAAKTRHGGNN